MKIRYIVLGHIIAALIGWLVPLAIFEAFIK